ncbi:RING/U-box superfamily protein isoform 1 [Hibiscus syriacus]|uniref:RING/U-box superfamily protein isoform 1 n=1 Tax=Hibiscus syriacus TaxID=106335 RepID=A0A6A2X9C8_HIBSY|nr:RING/U-box superfamily protein isoform 1 [Hibiscus syriacus]
MEKRRDLVSSRSPPKCPNFFKFIYRDLEPWFETWISIDIITKAKKQAAFRAVIVEGKLFVYTGMVPDVDIMFDFMDKPSNRVKNGSLPLPLLRYCTTEAHLDIPFPDCNFIIWGYKGLQITCCGLSPRPEVNKQPWDVQFKKIKQGSQAQTWAKKIARAHWKGNPDVESPIRMDLMQCNDTNLWGTEIIRQNWTEEAKAGYEHSKLSDQFIRYMLKAMPWPVPKLNYWPVSSVDLCRSIKFAVDWGNTNPSKVEAIGKSAQQLMGSISMDRVYDYMFHLMSQYAKLQDFKPVPPSSAQQVCEEPLLCFADEKQKEVLKESAVTAVSSTPSCTLIRRPNPDFFNIWAEQKQKMIDFFSIRKSYFFQFRVILVNSNYQFDFQ